LSDKIKLAYGLALIGEQTRRDLNRLRDIRNAFAHARQNITFDTKAIANICGALELPSDPRFPKPNERFPHNFAATYKESKNPRERFFFTVTRIMSRLSLAWDTQMMGDPPQSSSHVP
jgi:hypothetical protein